MAAYSGSYRPPERMKQKLEESPVQQEEKSSTSKKYPTGPELSMQGILKKIEAVGLETDDLLLALVLFLMYRESGDKDLLILLGAMLLS